MLLALPQAPHGRLFHALTEYLAAYHAVLERAVPDGSPNARRAVQAAQDAYDVYSEQRDPAIGLFRSYFGHEVGNVSWVRSLGCLFSDVFVAYVQSFAGHDLVSFESGHPCK